MKKNRLSVVALIFTLCIMITGILSVNIQASTSKKAAMKAYKKMLSKSTLKTHVDETPSISTSKLQFGIAYIDKNNVPELVIRRKDHDSFGFGRQDILMYTYYKGKVRQINLPLLGSVGLIDGDGSMNWLQKPRYYKKTGTFFSSGEYGEQVYWKLSKGKAKNNIWYDDETGGYYNSKGRISKSVFNSSKKKITRNKSASYFKFYNNTSKNRKKRLK